MQKQSPVSFRILGYYYPSLDLGKTLHIVHPRNAPRDTEILSALMECFLSCITSVAHDMAICVSEPPKSIPTFQNQFPLVKSQ
jgi:hypothetical protein